MSTETHLSKEIEKVLVTGDLARLTPEERLEYYKAVCESIGLNPLTQPLDYILLNGKLRLYAKKDATDQLRRIYDISVEELKHDFRKDLELYIVTASGHNKDSRRDVSTGAVSVGGLRADALANAIMKAETKAKRRLTLSLCGLGMLDETELETIPEIQLGATPASVVPLPPPVPAVNQVPAEGKAEPRPGEKTWSKPDGGVVTEKQLTEQESKVEAAKAAVPTLKPASELPPPEKKKRGPKPKPSPNNGQVPGEITDADIPTAENPLPPAPTEAEKEANKQEAGEFVESIDPTPTPEEQKGFTARVRALAASGALNADLKNYILNVGKKSDPKQLTVGNWKQALGELESLDKDKLKEATKAAPLPKEF